MRKQRICLAICDDEAMSLNRLQKLAVQTLGTQWELNVYCTHSPEELLEQAIHVQIAILDIQLPQHNGIALAQRLLEKNPGCCIIFVSGYVRYVSDVYDVPHLCMVLKDQVDAQLPKYLHRAACVCSGQSSKLFIRHDGVEQAVEMERINYLERRGRLTYINLQNGQQFQTRDKLDSLLDGIDSAHICRCHVSFAVNMRWVLSMEEREFLMKDGSVVPISRANKLLVKKQYFDYLKCMV